MACLLKFDLMKWDSLLTDCHQRKPHQLSPTPFNTAVLVLTDFDKEVCDKCSDATTDQFKVESAYSDHATKSLVMPNLNHF